MTEALKPPARPCGSCPYRRDVPSGVWAVDEYVKLPQYDGDMIDQFKAGAFNLFMCHQRDGCLCGGWLATHGPKNLVALRMTRSELDASVFDYVSDVPVFSSGSDAARHGIRDIEEPGPEAEKLIAKLVKLNEGKSQ